MLRYAVGTTSMLLAASAAVAQAPRLREVHRVLPPRYLAAFGGEHVADINGDGLSDVVFGWSAWLRRDDDTFELRHYADFPSTGNPMDQALVDIDGDGDVDRVIANGPFVGGSGPWNDVIERNDGNGNFTSLPKIELIGSGGPSTCVAAADVNGDGAIDIVVGSEYLGPSPPPQERAFQVFINYGGGVFTLESARDLWTPAIRTNGLALVDFDADGDLDLYLANDVRLGNSDRLYENDGAGNFTTV
ncbi:MAG: FG-GAP repeat domain-containing protein, partial [Planctomycetota bacterium]